jgi:hypothetical protein
MMKHVVVMLAAGLIGLTALGLWASDEPNGSPPRPRARRARTRPPGVPHKPEHGVRLTEAQEAELLEYVRQRRPQMYERLAGLKDSNPWRYRRSLKLLWHVYQRVQAMPADQREAFLAEHDARVEVMRLVEQLGAATDPEEVDALKGRLKAAIRDQFAAEQKHFEARLARLERQVIRLRAALKDRQSRQREIIEERYGRALKASRSGAKGRWWRGRPRR